MLEEIKTFYSNNTTMVILAAVALIAMLGMFMFKSSLFKKTNNTMDMAMGSMGRMGDMPGMSGMNEMCDPNSGMCQPHAMMNMPPPSPTMMTMTPPSESMMNIPSPTIDSSNNDTNNEPNFDYNNESSNENPNYDTTNYDNTNYDNTNYEQ